jgi:hypothetical protein
MDSRHMYSLPPLRLLSITALLLCIIVCDSAPAFARAGDRNIGEDVAIAFFKAGGTNPDFDLWAKNSMDYKVAAPARAAEVLQTEKQRILKKWQAYNPEENVLEVKGNVNVELKAFLTKEGEEQYWMYMSFDQGEITYFPYKYQNYLFAVIPQQIESLMIQQLQKEQYLLIRKDFQEKDFGVAALTLQLKPVKSYTQQPYNIDDKEQWALLCDIATMALASQGTGQSMWNHSADWYVSPVRQELQDLYQQPSDAPVH